jgi:hypothetical protein
MPVFNRRNFLAGLGASAAFLSSPEKILMGSLFDGVFNQARAASSGVDEKILINIFLQNGPPRWYFDLPIQPNGNDTVIDNGMVKNKFVLENGIIKAVFENYKVGNFYLPYLWKANIPTSNGGSIPMANLAQSAVFIRGYNLINDGHYQNIVKHNSPVTGAPTLSGIFADHSSRAFSAVTTTNSYQHKSANGKSIISAPLNGDPFSSMMAPFNLAAPKSFNRRQAMDNAIKDLHSNVSAFFGSKNPYASSLISERDSMIELFLKGTTGLKDKYLALYNKYRSLEVRAYTELPLEGLDDLEIIVQKNFNYNIQTSTVITPSDIGGDLRSIYSADSFIGSMAESFAIAEYLVNEKLTSSIMVGLNTMNKMNFANFKYVNNGTSTRAKDIDFLNFDSHATGSHVSLYAFSKFYRAFAACLYELTTALEQKNLYDSTIIQLSSDFNRSAQTQGSGADHGFIGCATSLYSGMFKTGNGPLVIGNVNNNKDGKISGVAYSGTWGIGAAVPEMGNRILNIGNLASTVTTLAGYESPTKNDAPLLKIINGKLVNLAGNPKNV